MAIPIRDLVRLVDHSVGDTLRNDPKMFDFWMKEGVSVTPDFDYQDIATLARITSGECYEEYVR